MNDKDPFAVNVIELTGLGTMPAHGQVGNQSGDIMMGAAMTTDVTKLIAMFGSPSSSRRTSRRVSRCRLP
ncbi:MAG: hypothetical protein ACRD0P_02055 [Stackebrandtia sp.]